MPYFIFRIKKKQANYSQVNISKNAYLALLVFEHQYFIKLFSLKRCEKYTKSFLTPFSGTIPGTFPR